MDATKAVIGGCAVVAALLLGGVWYANLPSAPPKPPEPVVAAPPAPMPEPVARSCVDFKGDGVGVMTPQDLKAKYTTARSFLGETERRAGIETWIFLGKNEPNLTIATQPIGKAVYRFLDGRLAEITLYTEDGRTKPEEILTALRTKYGASSSGDDLFVYWDIDGDCYVKFAPMVGNTWFGSKKMKAEFDKRSRAAMDRSIEERRDKAAKDL